MVSLIPRSSFPARFSIRGPASFKGKSAPATTRNASEEWRKATWADAKTTPYLVEKGVKGFKVKGRPDGSLLIPARLTPKGPIADLFVIEENGNEKFMSGNPVRGLHHVIDPEDELERGATVVVAQDYATAAGLHQALRVPTVVAFTPENLITATAELRNADSDRQIVIAADVGNAVEAAEAASRVGAQVVSAPEKTFNDEIKARGPKAVRRILAKPLKDKAFLLWDSANWSKIEGLKAGPEGTLLVPGRDIYGNLAAVFKVQDPGRPPILIAGRKERRDLVHICDPDKVLAGAKATTVAEALELHAKLKVPTITVLSPPGKKMVVGAIRRRWPKIEIVSLEKGQFREKIGET